MTLATFVSNLDNCVSCHGVADILGGLSIFCLACTLLIIFFDSVIIGTATCLMATGLMVYLKEVWLVANGTLHAMCGVHPLVKADHCVEMCQSTLWVHLRLLSLHPCVLVSLSASVHSISYALVCT